MEGSVYKIIEVVGTSPNSWEDATKVAIETASGVLEDAFAFACSIHSMVPTEPTPHGLKDLRIGEVVRQDVTIENGKITGFRVRLNVSFKYHPSGA